MSNQDDGAALRPFDRSLPMALLKAREATMRLFRPTLADHDLTEQQWRVLRALGAADQPLEVGTVAERTFLLGPSLSRILSNLAERRLIDRRPVAHDQRRAEIGLTDEGRQLVATIAPSSETTYALIEDRFGRARLDTLLAELHDLVELTAPHAEEKT